MKSCGHSYHLLYSCKLRVQALNRLRLNYSICKKSFLSNNNSNFTSSSSKLISEKLRNAQASELFRSNYYQSKNSDSFISLNDLDQLIVQERVRPSILLDIYAITGQGLGLLSRLSPKSCSNMITAIIDESTTQQFNDSIRSMQLNEVINYDIKETLKYHRDLTNNANASENTSSTAHGYANTANCIENDDNTTTSNNATSTTTTNDDVNANMKTILTTAVYHILKLSEKY